MRHFLRQLWDQHDDSGAETCMNLRKDYSTAHLAYQAIPFTMSVLYVSVLPQPTPEDQRERREHYS
jgi:hypothetical protein